MQAAGQIEISEQDYLDGEELAQIKHEYVAGQVFAMAGTSKNHGRIVGNLHAALHGRLRGGPCEAFVADLKVRIRRGPAYYYPDLVVTCDPRDKAADSPTHFLEHPSCIIEVLSPTTERTDRLEKLMAYRHIPELSEYVLVDQERRWVEIYRRTDKGWLHVALGPGDDLALESVGVSLTLEQVYESTGVTQRL